MSVAGNGTGEQKSSLSVLALGAIGVVFGDIGTSPLYALKECFGSHGMELNPTNVLGLLSMVFWAMMLVVTLKYVTVIMRADNNGEGGILALLALVQRLVRKDGRRIWLLSVLGIFGAALFYGDSVITPAISVLSAVEGLTVLAPSLHTFVVPVTVGILVGLFLIQRKGTESVGLLFGPVMLVWFFVLGVLGVREIMVSPDVLRAVSPVYAFDFFTAHPMLSFLTLGSVVLVVTGGEALYTDMSHFGAKPIRLAWLAVVAPGLVLNYMGQGALLLTQPEAVKNPFFLLAPEWALLPLIVLATAATVIASQAVISGAFSVTRQAIQLGYLPRMQILHTSAKEAGQIYLPFVNWLLLVGVILLVVGFKSSSSLASAYGIAVTGAMLIDNFLVVVVMLSAWRWKIYWVVPLVGLFLCVDLAFLAANSFKIPSGGWLALLIALVLFVLLTTWSKGRQLLASRIQEQSLERSFFVQHMVPELTRVAGVAMYLTTSKDRVPGALLHNLKHNKVLHEKVAFLTVDTLDVPVVADAEQAEVVPLGNQCYSVCLRFGFMQSPDIPQALGRIVLGGEGLDMMDTSFFLGRESLVMAKQSPLTRVRRHVFFWLTKNAASAMEFFHLPPNRVVEVGGQLEI